MRGHGQDHGPGPPVASPYARLLPNPNTAPGSPNKVRQLKKKYTPNPDLSHARAPRGARHHAPVHGTGPRVPQILPTAKSAPSLSTASHSHTPQHYTNTLFLLSIPTRMLRRTATDATHREVRALAVRRLPDALRQAAYGTWHHALVLRVAHGADQRVRLTTACLAVRWWRGRGGRRGNKVLVIYLRQAVTASASCRCRSGRPARAEFVAVNEVGGVLKCRYTRWKRQGWARKEDRIWVACGSAGPNNKVVA